MSKRKAKTKPESETQATETLDDAAEPVHGPEARATRGGADVEFPPTDEEGAVEGEGEEAEAVEPDLKARLKEVLEVAVEDAGVLRKRLTITVPAETIREERDKQFGELARDAMVPGFRRGRAPRRLVEKRFGHEVDEQIQVNMIGQSFYAATELKELKVLGEPEVWTRTDADDEEKLVDVETALKRIKLPDEGPLTYRCEVEIWPEFELPKLQSIQVKRPRVKITKDDVDKQIGRLRSMRGSWEPLPDGKVQDDDLVITDVVMKVDGEVIKSAENERLFARAQRVEGVSLEDFGKSIRGASIGKLKTVKATIPDDHEREDLRGKPVEFTLTVREIKRFKTPPIDEQFLQSHGFETEKEFRDYVRAQMEAEMERAVQEGMRGQVARYLLSETRLDLPPQLSQRHIERTILRRVIELRREGLPPEEIEKHADELRTTAAQQALVRLKLQFIMDRLGEELGMTVSEEELNAQIAAIARRYNRRFDRVRDELSQGNGLAALYTDIRDEKCLDKLLEDAEIQETEGPAQSVSELAEAT